MDIKYFAGLFDGEGCIMLSKFRKITSEFKRGIRFNPIMTIANTYVPVLEDIHASFGGRIRAEHHKCYAIYFNAGEMRDLLPKLIPYLIIKKSQAEIMLKYLDKTLELGPQPISDEHFALYEKWFQELKDIKKIRFQHDWSPKVIAEKECSVCRTKFLVYSNRPQKMFCNDYCKRKSDWTRSNARIRAGIPAWNGIN